MKIIIFWDMTPCSPFSGLQVVISHKMILFTIFIFHIIQKIGRWQYFNIYKILQHIKIQNYILGDNIVRRISKFNRVAMLVLLIIVNEWPLKLKCSYKISYEFVSSLSYETFINSGKWSKICHNINASIFKKEAASRARSLQYWLWC
jgi:hypothetical protein